MPCLTTGSRWLAPGGAFTLSGGGRSVTVDLVSGYPFAQVFAPAGHELIALEPMTAPTNALTTGRSLPIVAPGERFSAVFRIRVEDESEATSGDRDWKRRAAR